MRREFLILAAFYWAVSCSSPEARPPNLVLVTIDTLRADRLGAYGNGSGLTPNLDRLAKSGVLFENASTASPLTLPAHASILTGTYPLHHGIRDNGGYYLAAESATLAETLSAHGYATGAFVGAFVLDSRWGLDQGFDRYDDEFDFSTFDDVSLGSVQRPGNVVLKNALLWMDEAGPRPFFSWIHLYDPHTPYDPPEPHRSRNTSRDWGLYDGEVAFVDELLGQLLDWLKQKALDENTLIIVTGDHGEGLGDHGEIEHGFFVYDSTMHVPLILRAPGSRRGGLRVQAQVRSIDLMPTVLDWLAIAAPPTVQGVSLRPLAEGEKDTLGIVAYGESHYPRAHYGWSELRSLRSEEFHFIEAPRPELYDLRRDREERENLAHDRADAAGELRQRLQSVVDQFSAGAVLSREPVDLDAETRDKLATLGYLGGPRRRSHPETGVAAFADPKDKIELHELVKAAEAEARAGRLKEALARLERVLARDPEVVEAYRIRGDLYRQTGDGARASESYRQALSLEPEYKVAAFQLALLELEAGRVDSAEAGLRRVLTLDPRDNKSYFLLARLLIARENFPAALETLERAIESTSDTAPFHVLKAECYVAQEDFEAAEAAIAKALALKPDVPRAHHYLGRLRERRGDITSAIDAYRREIVLFPHDPETFLSLAALLRQRGELAAEIGVLEEAIEKIPRAAGPYVLLGRAYAEVGQNQRARSLLQHGLSLTPSPENAALGRRTLAQLEVAK